MCESKETSLVNPPGTQTEASPLCLSFERSSRWHLWCCAFKIWNSCYCITLPSTYDPRSPKCRRRQDDWMLLHSQTFILKGKGTRNCRDCSKIWICMHASIHRHRGQTGLFHDYVLSWVFCASPLGTNGYYFSTNPGRGSKRVKSGGECDVKRRE